VLNVSGYENGIQRFEMESLPLAPRAELRGGPSISKSSVWISDVCGEELNESE